MGEKDLFGKAENPDDEVRIYLYCDEIKKIKNYKGEKWFYIGMLIVEESKKENALFVMNKAREETNYYSELHFCKLSNFSYANNFNEKTLLAKKWIELILEDRKNKNFYFNILGICATNLSWHFFGNKKDQMHNAYNRFFRTLLKSTLNYYFPGKEVVVVDIFHDNEQAMQLHKYFDWHSVYKLSKELENVHFENEFINFIDSDHNKEKNYPVDSHFIQMTDLILGAFRQSFDNTCKKDGCKEIASDFSPLLEKMIKAPKNINSRYGYHRKFNFGFFPPQGIENAELVEESTTIKNLIFRNRPLPFINQGQEDLFF